MAKTFKEVIAWQKAHQLTLNIYQITNHFPDSEKFGLTSQMRRCSVSIPSNIAEGFKRHGYRDGMNFLNISETSLEELKYQTLLSFDLHYIDQTTYDRITLAEDEVGRLINGWKRSLLPK